MGRAIGATVSREIEAIATTKTSEIFAFSNAELGAGGLLIQSGFTTRQVSEGLIDRCYARKTGPLRIQVRFPSLSADTSFC